MKANQQNIKKNLQLVFSVTAFFIIVNTLNFLNAAENVDSYWKLAGAFGVVLYIATLKAADTPESSSDKVPINE